MLVAFDSRFGRVQNERRAAGGPRVEFRLGDVQVGDRFVVEHRLRLGGHFSQYGL